MYNTKVSNKLQHPRIIKQIHNARFYLLLFLIFFRAAMNFVMISLDFLLSFLFKTTSPELTMGAIVPLMGTLRHKLHVFRQYLRKKSNVVLRWLQNGRILEQSLLSVHTSAVEDASIENMQLWSRTRRIMVVRHPDILVHQANNIVWRLSAIAIETTGYNNWKFLRVSLNSLVQDSDTKFHESSAQGISKHE